MTKIVAGITTSIDGYITGPNDGPEAGLGEGGERLHYWVFGGPWRYEDERSGEATGADKAYIDQAEDERRRRHRRPRDLRRRRLPGAAQIRGRSRSSS